MTTYAKRSAIECIYIAMIIHFFDTGIGQILYETSVLDCIDNVANISV